MTLRSVKPMSCSVAKAGRMFGHFSHGQNSHSEYNLPIVRLTGDGFLQQIDALRFGTYRVLQTGNVRGTV